jgi:hypothetical protein
MNARAHIPEPIQHRVLDRSRRRCALCVHFDNDWARKEGQIAHLDRDPSNFAEDNLAFLCLPHHDDYDTKRRQTKNHRLQILLWILRADLVTTHSPLVIAVLHGNTSAE